MDPTYLKDELTGTGLTETEYIGSDEGIDTTPRPWREHARIADLCIDLLARSLMDDDEPDDEPDDDLITIIDGRADYHARKATLGYLLSLPQDDAPREQQKVIATGKHPDVSTVKYDRSDPRHPNNRKRGSR